MRRSFEPRCAKNQMGASRIRPAGDTIDPAHDDVVEGAERVDAGFAGHDDALVKLR